VSSKTNKYVIVWVSDDAGTLVHILIEPVENDPVNRYKVRAMCASTRRHMARVLCRLTQRQALSFTATCLLSLCGK
jgi:hypothetical protein